MASHLGIERRPRHANAFLDSLDNADADRVDPLLRAICCDSGDRLTMDGGPAALIYFPVTLVACLSLRSQRNGIGLVGREGVFGWSAMFGHGPSDQEASVLLEGGTMLAAPVDRIREACMESPTLLLRFLQSLDAYNRQLSCMVRACGSATLKERLSAWLLMLHDRIDGNLIRITHGNLAAQLAVRRASITEVMHLLEGEGAVRCQRGLIQICRRDALEECAGTAYRQAVEPQQSSDTLDDDDCFMLPPALSVEGDVAPLRVA